MGQIQLRYNDKLIWRRRRRVKNVSLWESLRLVFININQAGAAGATWHHDTRQRTVKNCCWQLCLYFLAATSCKSVPCTCAPIRCSAHAMIHFSFIVIVVHQVRHYTVLNQAPTLRMNVEMGTITTSTVSIRHGRGHIDVPKWKNTRSRAPIFNRVLYNLSIKN